MAKGDEMKIGSRWYVSIDIDEAKPGDRCSYAGHRGRGRYFRRIEKITRAGVRIKGFKYKGHVVYPPHTVHRRHVLDVWTRRAALTY